MATSTLTDRIADDLRDQIASGSLSPGAFLPSNPQLQDDYSASRDTVRNATNRLVNEGLVEHVPGRTGGIRVRQRVLLTYLASKVQHKDGGFSGADAFFGSTRQQGYQPSQDFSVFLASLNAEFAELLHVEAGTSAVVRRCLRKVNDEPIGIQDSYYPRWLTDEVPELFSPRDIPVGTTQFLAERGYDQTAYDDLIVARMPTPEESNLLELKPGTTILDVKRVTYMPDGRPARLGHEVCDGTRYRRRYQLGDLNVISSPGAVP